MNKLAVPLLTPYLNGSFDFESMSRLVKSVDSYVDSYVPCLSTGEGSVLRNETWAQVVSGVVTNTQKPVFAGILDKGQETSKYIDRAEDMGCYGCVIPLSLYPKQLEEIIEDVESKNMKVIVYNQDKQPTLDEEYICKLCTRDNVVGFKDSSSNKEFLKRLINAKGEDTSWDIYQGMELDISENDSVDGYMVSLANVEPEFCALLKNDNLDISKLRSYIDTYKLKSDDWYLMLKQALKEKGIFSSSEAVKFNQL